MIEKFKIRLTRIEIATLSAMLGHDFIIGLEDDNRYKFEYDAELFIQTKNELERKSLIRYGLDNELYIDFNLRAAIDMLSRPVYVIDIADAMEANKKYIEKVFFDDNYYLKLHYDSDLGMYDLSLFDAISPEEYVENSYGHLYDSSSEMRINLPIESVIAAKDKLNTFQREDAFDLISKEVEERVVAELVLDVISGNHPYISLRIYELKAHSLVNRLSVFFVAVDGIMARVSFSETSGVAFLFSN